jgi:hypothetical protein
LGREEGSPGGNRSAEAIYKNKNTENKPVPHPSILFRVRYRPENQNWKRASN